MATRRPRPDDSDAKIAQAVQWLAAALQNRRKHGAAGTSGKVMVLVEFAGREVRPVTLSDVTVVHEMPPAE